MKLLILSDIHGNQSALQSVLDRAASYTSLDACVLLGDLIDYGMHSNEVLQMLKQLPYPILCNIQGNHEAAILQEEYDRFAFDRGRDCARYTRSILQPQSWEYLRSEMEPSAKKEFECGGKKCLAVHGSLEDLYWKSIFPNRMHEIAADYSAYDYVFSGHSHLSHFMENFIMGEEPLRRRKKKTVFINPGSVGQPRNLNPMAQFVILDMETEQASFEKVPYDIEKEQACYHGQVDDYYRERLTWGI